MPGQCCRRCASIKKVLVQCWAIGADGCYNIVVSRRHIPAKPDHTAKNDRFILCQINVEPAPLQWTNKHWVDVCV